MRPDNRRRRDDEPKSVVLPFPARGVDRSLPVAQQPPLTAPDLLNVVAFPPLSDRGGGGKRDGTVKESPTRLTSINSSVYTINALYAFIGTSTSLTPSGGGTPTEWEDVGDGLGAAGTCLATYGATTDLFIAGAFTTAGTFSTSKFAKFDIDTGLYTGYSPGLPNTRINPGRFLVWDAGDGSGECLYLVGGTQSGSVNQVARFNGTSWTDLGAGTTGVTGITDLCVADGKLYVCGQFSQLGSTGTAAAGCNNVARWDPTKAIGTWDKLPDSGSGSAFNGVTNAGVDGTGVAYCMATGDMRTFKSGSGIVTRTMVYVGGNFTASGSHLGSRMLAQYNVDDADWDYPGGIAACGPTSGGIVQDLCLVDLGDGPTLYIGGSFINWNSSSTSTSTLGDSVMGGVHPSDHCMITSLRAGGTSGVIFEPLGQGIRGPRAGSLEYGVLSIEPFNDGVSPGIWVAGRFHACSDDEVGLAAPSVAKWDGRSWTTPGRGLAGSGATAVRHMIPAGPPTDQVLYATGSFTVKNNKAAGALAAWDGSEWSSLTGAGYAGEPSSTFNACLLYVASLPSDTTAKLYVSIYGNPITGVNAQYGCGPCPPAVGALTARYTLATWDGTRWREVPGWTSTTQHALAMVRVDLAGGSSPRLYAAGNFTVAGGGPGARIASFDGSSWTAMGSGTTSGDVYTLATDGTSVYAGGTFTGMGGVANTDGIARWDGSAWQAMGTGTDGLTSVDALCWNSTDSKLYVGGVFTGLGGVADADNVGTWEPGTTTWAALDKGLNGKVRAIAKFGSDIYACGAFTADGNGTAMARIAKWNGTAWVAIGGSSGGLNGEARAMYVHDDGSGSKLYIAGAFTSFTDGSTTVTVGGICRWDGTNFSAVDETGSTVKGFGAMPTAAACPTALHAYDGDLIAAGFFLEASGETATYIAKASTV